MTRPGALTLAIVAALLVISPPASAEPNDKAALKLRDEAINTHYLAASYAEAEAALGQALGMCGGSDCAPKVRARIRCDLGVVLFAQGKSKEARIQFQKALADDPTVKIHKDLSTPPAEAAFTEAKEAGAPPPAPAAAEGTMIHTPPTEQAALTPVPIYVELPDDVEATRVFVRYKPFGQTDWKTAPMHKVGKGWGVELPCLDVGSMTGDLVYFVQAADASGEIVASTGTTKAPHRVPIAAKLAGKPPHLPGEPPPVACADPADCPPGFPGCKSSKGETGAACETDTECSAGWVCNARLCERGPDAPKTGPAKENYLGISFQQDLMFVSAAEDACNGGNGYACFDGDTYYDRIPLASADNQVNGGVGVATRRILASYERRVTNNVTLGTKIGFAFSGGPSRPDGHSFFPLHLELRAVYYFGGAPLATTGIHPFISGAGGLAQVDAKVAVDVYADRPAYNRNEALNVDAWKKSGNGFISAGLGVLISPKEGQGFVIEARIMQMLITPATAMGIQVGYMFGL